MTTRQTVSISNIHGGVALDADEGGALADLLEWASHWRPDSELPLHMRDRARLRRVINVLRGHAPSGPRRYHLYGGADLEETR